LEGEKKMEEIGQIKSYEYSDEEILDIGNDFGLDDITIKVFFDYVKERGFIRKDPYIEEWAERFSDGDEWARSDTEGKKILMKLYEKYFNLCFWETELLGKFKNWFLGLHDQKQEWVLNYIQNGR